MAPDTSATVVEAEQVDTADESEPINEALRDRQRRNMGDRLGSNVFSNYAVFVSNLFINLYLTRYLVNTLGQEMYGAWLLIGSIIVYLGIVDMGFGSSVQKYVAEFAARGQEQRIVRLICTTSFMFAGLALVLLALSVAATPLIGTLFNVPKSQIADTRFALVLMGVVQGVALPLGVYTGALMGLLRMDLNNMIGIVGTLSIPVLVVLFVGAGWGLAGICSAYLIVTIVAGIARVAAVKALIPALVISPRNFDRSILRSTSTYGFTFFGLKVAHYLKYYTQNMVIAGFMTAGFVTPYAVANRLATTIRQVVDQAVEILVPVFSQLDSSQETSRVRALYYQAGKLSVGLGAPLALCLCVYARPVLKTWLTKVPPQSDLLTVILAITVFASVVPAVSVRLMLGMAKHRTLAIVTFIDSVLNLLISIALIRPFGLVGVALGTSIPLFVSHVFIFPWLGCRLIGISTTRFLLVLLKACGLPLIPSGIAAAIMVTYAPPASFISLFIQGAVVILIYIAAFAAWSLDHDERQQYKYRLSKIIPGARSAA